MSSSGPPPLSLSRPRTAGRKVVTAQGPRPKSTDTESSEVRIRIQRTMGFNPVVTQPLKLRHHLKRWSSGSLGSAVSKRGPPLSSVWT